MSPLWKPSSWFRWEIGQESPRRLRQFFGSLEPCDKVLSGDNPGSFNLA